MTKLCARLSEIEFHCARDYMYINLCPDGYLHVS